MMPGDTASTALEVYRVLTVRQPWADLIMAGVKDVENRTWPVPSTVLRCPTCNGRPGSWRSTIRFDGGDIPAGLGHTPCPWCDDTPPEEYAEEAFPFRLWIHAAKAEQAYNFADLRGLVVGTPRAKELIQAYHVKVSGAPRLGALLGPVTVTGCHHADDGFRCVASECAGCDAYLASGGIADPCDDDHFCSRWAEPDVWHWTLTDPQPLDQPIPAKGRLGLWTLPDDIAIPA